MFIEGTINSPNPAAAFYTELATALTAEGFVLMDTVTFGPRTHKVWKSLAADNVLGKDWFLDVTYEATGGTNVWFVPFEDYNATTHLAFRGPPNISEGATLSTGTAGGATGYPLEDDLWMNAGYIYWREYPFWLALVASYDMGYWCSVTSDRVVAMVSNDSQRLTYAGLFQPSPRHVAASGVNLFPLVAGRIGTTGTYSDDYMSVNRIPGRSTAEECFSVLSEDGFPTPPRLADRGAPEAQGGTPLAHAVWLASWGSWIGTFYGIASVPVDGGSFASELPIGVGRGDVVKTNQTIGISTPNAEWVLSAPRETTGLHSFMLKKE